MTAERNLLTDNLSTLAQKVNRNEYVLRNYIAEKVINAAEEGDFGPCRKVLEILKNPYTDEVFEEYAGITPSSDIVLKVT